MSKYNIETMDIKLSISLRDSIVKEIKAVSSALEYAHQLFPKELIVLMANIYIQGAYSSWYKSGPNADELRNLIADMDQKIINLRKKHEQRTDDRGSSKEDL